MVIRGGDIVKGLGGIRPPARIMAGLSLNGGCRPDPGRPESVRGGDERTRRIDKGLDAEWLGQDTVEGAVFEKPGGAGNTDYGNRFVGRPADMPGDALSIKARHAHVSDHNVKSSAIELLNPFVAVFGDFNPMTGSR